MDGASENQTLTPAPLVYVVRGRVDTERIRFIAAMVEAEQPNWREGRRVFAADGRSRCPMRQSSRAGALIGLFQQQKKLSTAQVADFLCRSSNEAAVCLNRLKRHGWVRNTAYGQWEYAMPGTAKEGT